MYLHINVFALLVVFTVYILVLNDCLSQNIITVNNMLFINCHVFIDKRTILVRHVCKCMRPFFFQMLMKVTSKSENL